MPRTVVKNIIIQPLLSIQQRHGQKLTKSITPFKSRLYLIQVATWDRENFTNFTLNKMNG